MNAFTCQLGLRLRRRLGRLVGICVLGGLFGRLVGLSHDGLICLARLVRSVIFGLGPVGL